jgi:predicted DNA-binding protein (MmcQ/YjbR family)
MTNASLEQFCTTLAGTTQDIKWGNDLCYLVGDKMYCVTGLEPPLTASLKVLPEEFSALTEREGIIPAPYMARNHWVLIQRASALSVKEWKHYVRQSYELVRATLPKKTQRGLGTSG